MLKPGDIVIPSWHSKTRSEANNGIRLSPDMMFNTKSVDYVDVLSPLTVLAVVPGCRNIDPDISSDNGCSILLLSKCGHVGWSLEIVLRAVVTGDSKC